MNLCVRIMVCPVRQLLLHLSGLLFIIEYGVTSLELLELRVPAHVPLGTRAALSCRWQLGPHDVLYSVKWYKDGKEFFRHVPRDVEPRRKFPLPGVDVELFDSSGGNLTLTPAVLESEGRYRCEVSGERPLFPTVSDHADMTVIALPDHGPILTGFKSRYSIGDSVKVVCTSGLSRPATRLSWYINGEPAPSSTVSPVSFEQTGELKRTHLELRFVVTEKDFKANVLKIKCLATLSSVYWRSNEESASKERSVHDHLKSRSNLGDVRVTRADRVQADEAIHLISSSRIIVFLGFVLIVLE